MNAQCVLHIYVFSIYTHMESIYHSGIIPVSFASIASLKAIQCFCVF